MAPSLFFFPTYRMLQSWELPSLVQRPTTTQFLKVSGVVGEVDGTVASLCRLLADSLCLCVSRNRSRENGWRLLEKSSLNPWHQKTTLVRLPVGINHYSSNLLFIWMSLSLVYSSLVQMKLTWEDANEWNSSYRLACKIAHRKLAPVLPNDASDGKKTNGCQLYLSLAGLASLPAVIVSDH